MHTYMVPRVYYAPFWLSIRKMALIEKLSVAYKCQRENMMEENSTLIQFVRSDMDSERKKK